MARPKPLTYAGLGVDVKIESKAAKILYQASKTTWINRRNLLGDVIVPYDDFAGTRFVRVENLPKGTIMYGGSDGIATKAALAEIVNKYDTLAHDLLAMVCDDAVVRGGEPVLVKSVLDVNTLSNEPRRLKYIKQLASGYEKAAKLANVAVINGEIAQLNDQMGDLNKFKLSWSADVTWFAHESRLLTGRQIKPGDYLVGLQETGVRCNGISLIRKCLELKYGKNLSGAGPLIKQTLKPSIIYSKAVVEMFGGYNLQQKPKAKLHGVAHITGGGIPEKLARALRPSGFGAEISDAFEPSEIFTLCQKLGNVNDEEAYKTWNMGQGMVIITPSPSDVIAIAKAHDMSAKIIGEIIRQPSISIVSRGAKSTGKKLVFST